MGTLDSYDFENMLQDDFFSGNEPEDINREIESRLRSDAAFAGQYESWITESSYTSWHDYYNEKEALEEESWDTMYAEEEEDDEKTKSMPRE